MLPLAAVRSVELSLLLSAGTHCNRLSADRACYRQLLSDVLHCIRLRSDRLGPCGPYHLVSLDHLAPFRLTRWPSIVLKTAAAPTPVLSGRSCECQLPQMARTAIAAFRLFVLTLAAFGSPRLQPAAIRSVVPKRAALGSSRLDKMGRICRE